MKLKTTLMSIAIGTSILASGQQPIYLDKTKPIEERVEDALSRMTLEEKSKNVPCPEQIFKRRSSAPRYPLK